MKLFIQIPCFNEEATIQETLRAIPKRIDGIDQIEILIIDDGSKDSTIAKARELGVRHVLQFNKNRGLAHAFRSGLEYCVRYGADVIVNTDGDNQYSGNDIPKLVKMVVEEKYDVVIGDRQVKTIQHFSPIKKFFQRAGSMVVRHLSETDIPDTTSGFRAYSREAALRMNILTNFSYTLESIIQAGKKGLKVGHVPVTTNAKTRESRLFKSMAEYMKKSAATILRIYAFYEPLKSFTMLGFFIALPGALLILRFVVFYAQGMGDGKIQSLIIAAVFLILGFIICVMGVLADIMGFHRKLLEENLYRMRQLEARLVAADATNRPLPSPQMDLTT